MIKIIENTEALFYTRFSAYCARLVWAIYLFLLFLNNRYSCGRINTSTRQLYNRLIIHEYNNIYTPSGNCRSHFHCTPFSWGNGAVV